MFLIEDAEKTFTEPRNRVIIMVWLCVVVIVGSLMWKRSQRYEYIENPIVTNDSNSILADEEVYK